jgi:murein DD-endopeptidase MepM/ murein hydrolase activator NlpD
MLRLAVLLCALAIVVAGCGDSIPAKKDQPIVVMPSDSGHVNPYDIIPRTGTVPQPGNDAGTVPASGNVYIVNPLPARSRAGFIWPVRGELLQRFSEPVAGGGGVRNHGIEIACATGTRVLAAKGGVANVSDAPGFGRSVIITHDDGMVTMYGHNSEILVADGSRVQQGQAIALSGSSGRAGTPRAGFLMLTHDGTPVDPVRYLP